VVEITVVESMAGFSLVLGAEVLAVTGGENHQQDLGKSTSRANDLAASSVNNDPDASIFDNKYHDAIARHRRAALDGFLPGSARDSRN